MTKTVTVDEIKAILEPVKYPGINFSLFNLGVIQDITVVDNKAVITLAFPFPQTPNADAIVASVKEPLEAKNIVTEIKTTIMTKEQVQDFLVTGREDWFSLG